MKRDKIIEEARERYDYAREQWSEVYNRIREDLEFSDPTNPQQWPEQVRRERQQAKRPVLTFDQIGQFARQVINQARRNKPAIKFLPVDDTADPKLAEVLQDLARQTEYTSRADVAYITALDQATRGGLGFFRLVIEDMPSVVVGQKCAKIKRVQEFESVLLDPDFTEPDGSDSRYGFVEENITRADFKKRFPKATEVDWQSDRTGWWSKDHVRVCEYYRIVEVTTNVIIANGQEMSEDDYWALVQQGYRYPAQSAPKTVRKCEHFLISGEEILESTEFPAEHVPIFPVLGNESWSDGKRNLGGCVRTAKDAQISYNLERCAEVEAVGVGPKAPWLTPLEAVEGLEKFWGQANTGNLAYLPYNATDEAGNPLPAKPERIAPAQIATGWVQLREASRNDIQSALGMYQAAVGNNPNSQSGRAVLAIQDRADVSSYHYIDNLALSIAHCGRVLTQVWPRIYDQEQVVRVLGEDDEARFVKIMPESPVAYAEVPTRDGTQIVINPSVGRYDVRAVVGPAYQTRQTEAAAELSELVNGNPQMLALLGDVWVELRGFPHADRIAKRLKAMLPPQVVAAENDEAPQLPPEVEQTLQQASQMIEQLQAQLQEAQAGIEKEKIKAEAMLQAKAMDVDARRDIEELKATVQMLTSMLQPPPVLAQEVEQDLRQ